MTDTQPAGTPAADDQRRCPVIDFRFGRCELYDGHLNRDDPGDRHRTGSVLWADDAQRTAAPTLTSYAGAVPDLTGGVDPVAYVKAQWCVHHDDAAVCASWLETPADTPEPSTRPAQPHGERRAAAGSPPGTLGGVPGVLGRALLDEDGNAWPANDREWAESERGPVREVLLVDPAAWERREGLADAARQLRAFMVDDDSAYAPVVRVLAAAVDALDRSGAGDPDAVRSAPDQGQPATESAPEPDSALPTADHCLGCNGELVRDNAGRLRHRSGSPLCAQVHYKLDPGELRRRLDQPAEPAPEPAGDGSGWEREQINELIRMLRNSGVTTQRHHADQVDALLLHFDTMNVLTDNQLRQAEGYVSRANDRAEEAEAERDAARAELAQAVSLLAQIGDAISPTGERPEEALPTLVRDVRALTEERDAARAELAEATEERDGLREMLHREQVETAELRTRLATARRDAAVRALGAAGTNASSAEERERLFRLANEYESGARPVPGSPQPARNGGGDNG